MAGQLVLRTRGPVRALVAGIELRPRSVALRRQMGGVAAGVEPVGVGMPSFVPPLRSGYSVFLDCQTAVQSLAAVVSGALRGPAVLTSVRIMDSANTSTTGQLWNMRRLDCSENNRLQVGTFNADGVPTGFVKDGVTLFQTGGFRDTVDTGGVLLDSWMRSAPSVAGPEHVISFDAQLHIPFSLFFVKFYHQNDTAATADVYVILTFQLLQEVARAEMVGVVGLPTLSPPARVPVVEARPWGLLSPPLAAVSRRVITELGPRGYFRRVVS